jgi:hypothetical protein
LTFWPKACKSKDMKTEDHETEPTLKAIVGVVVFYILWLTVWLFCG